MALIVADVMARDLAAVAPDDSIVDAGRAMREADTGDVLVIEDDGTLSGMLTDRDIAIRAVADAMDPSGTKVDDVCSHELTTVSANDGLELAIRMMREHAVRRLPVVENGRAIGVISIGDLAMERDPNSALADISAAPGNH
jgi:CBS domain-containing protein